MTDHYENTVYCYNQTRCMLDMEELIILLKLIIILINEKNNYCLSRGTSFVRNFYTLLHN